MHCSICHRPLKDAASLARGMGPICAQKAQRSSHEMGSATQQQAGQDTPLVALELAEAHYHALVQAAELATVAAAQAEQAYRLALASPHDRQRERRIAKADAARQAGWAQQQAFQVALDETQQQLRALKRTQRKIVA